MERRARFGARYERLDPQLFLIRVIGRLGEAGSVQVG